MGINLRQNVIFVQRLIKNKIQRVLKRSWWVGYNLNGVQLMMSLGVYLMEINGFDERG